MPPERFLIIRRDNIGDLVCTLPLIRRLREARPQAWIGALVTRYNLEVLHGLPELDAVFAYQKAKHRAQGESALGAYWARARQLWHLRQMRLTAVLLPAGGGQASARRMAGWLAPGRIIAQDDLPAAGPAHEAELAARVLAPLGIDTGDLPAARIVPRPDCLATARRALPAGGPLVGVHLSARRPAQRWTAEQYVAFIRAAHTTDPGRRFALFWSPGDASNPAHAGDDTKAAEVAAQLGDLPVTPYPTHALSALIAGLACCDRVVCADGGHMHLAGALGKPLVALFGDSDTVRWRPWGVDHRLLVGADRTVAAITPGEAVAALDGLG